MRRILASVGAISVALWTSLTWAACPTGGVTIEAYVYGCPLVSGPFASSLFIPAVPNSTVAPTSSLEYIPANVFATLTDTQTLTSKTLTSPVFGGTITGTYTLGGTPSMAASALTGTLLAAQEPAHTGDATNSAGSLAMTLATVNSNVGTFASATFNGKGLATAASNLTGDVTTIGSAATLANTAVTPGSYTNTNLTVDSKGRITAAANGSGGASGISGLTTGQLGIAGSATTISSSVPFGLTGVSTVVETDSGGKLTASLIPNTAVAPGSYTNTNITVGADGRVTAAANGSAGSGGLSGMTAGQIPIAATSNTVTSSANLSGDVTSNSSLATTIAANAVTTSKINNAGVTYGKLQNETASTLLGNPTGSPAAPSEITLGTNLSFAGSVLNASSAAGASFKGVVSGGPTSYTAVSSGFTATAGFTFCSDGAWPLANGANPQLNVQSTGLKPIKLLTPTGLTSLVNSEIPLSGAVCFLLDGSATNYVYQPNTVAAASIAVSDTATPVKFAGGQSYNILTAGQTITLAPASTLPPGGGIFVQTGDVTAQLCVNNTSGDAINNGQVGGGAANGCITLPANLTQTQVYFSGTAGTTSAFTVSLGPVQYKEITWTEGLNLSAAPRYIGHVATPRVLYSIQCTVITAAGSAGVLHFWSTADGTAPASGTALDTGTAIDVNAASNTKQSATLAATVLVTGYNQWFTSTSTGTAGNGGCTFGYR